MSQSSPEGIILGKGSKLISHKLVFSDKEAKPYAANPLILDEIGQFQSVTDKEYVKERRDSLTQEQINSI